MSDAHPPLLVVQRLTLAYGNIIAIHHMSFTARDGEITGIVGPEGAGKTSVLNCISGLSHPSVGRMEFRCRPGAPLLLERMEPRRIVREARIVRTFRNPRVFAGLTVLENVLVAQNAVSSRASLCSALPGFWNGRKGRERARHWLDRLALSHVAGSLAGALSPGLRRRVEIARALATGPRLLCMDEPAAGLDEWERDGLIRRLQGSKGEMPAILITGRDFRMAESLCDHVIALDCGACVASGRAGDLQGHAPVLRAALGVPPGGETVPRISASC